MAQLVITGGKRVSLDVGLPESQGLGGCGDQGGVSVGVKGGTRGGAKGAYF